MRWPKDDRIDWLLFRSQLERSILTIAFCNSNETNPQTYVGECVNGIFSLLKKDYDTPRKRALAATARLQQMPLLLEQGLEQFAESGQTLRATRHSICALDRFAFQSKA